MTGKSPSRRRQHRPAKRRERPPRWFRAKVRAQLNRIGFWPLYDAATASVTIFDRQSGRPLGVYYHQRAVLRYADGRSVAVAMPEDLAAAVTAEVKAGGGS